jgi:alpha,alpha-trehalase
MNIKQGTKTQLEQKQDTQLQESLAFYQSDLFFDVQTSGLFVDSKVFADALAKFSWHKTYEDYAQLKICNDFNLGEFVFKYFTLPESIILEHDTSNSSLMGHIELLWGKLKKQPDETRGDSLLPLQYPYIVPGGRFREVYYWDSYFTSLGLMQTGLQDMVTSMIDNFIDLQDRIGCIPNGNRSYYATRSQPPVLALMTELILSNDEFDESQRSEFMQRAVHGLEQEYAFWMQGGDSLTADNRLCQRVVRMPDGEVLNRYWDSSTEPRPESLKEDLHAASKLAAEHRGEFYRNIRAACESGWDFSTRWLDEEGILSSIHTTQLVPIDLNCLLYALESVLSRYYLALGQLNEHHEFVNKGRQRKDAIIKYLWNSELGYFFDFDIKLNQQSKVQSLAGAVPLFVELVDEAMAARIAKRIEAQFLVSGGLVTTLNHSHQQWDAPNGWAPLHWFAVKGLTNYQQNSLALTVIERWLNTVEQHFIQHKSLMEKYNVISIDDLAEGGEYEVQHGFGWTNGVTLAFFAMQKELCGLQK